MNLVIPSNKVSNMIFYVGSGRICSPSKPISNHRYSELIGVCFSISTLMVRINRTNMYSVCQCRFCILISLKFSNYCKIVFKTSVLNNNYYSRCPNENCTGKFRWNKKQPNRCSKCSTVINKDTIKNYVEDIDNYLSRYQVKFA